MRIVHLTLAGLFLLLAVLGVVLPILPTTPFVLLASWCLLQSSPRGHQWLQNTRLFGPLLREWEAHHAVRLHVKVTAVSVIVLVVGASLCFGDLSGWWKVLLVAVAAMGLFVVLRLRTRRAS